MKSLSINIIFFLLFKQAVWGQFSGTFNFSGGGNDVTSFSYNGTAISNLTVSAITKNGVTSSSSTGNYRASSWTTGSTNGGAAGGSIEVTDYFEFTITASSGFTISNPTLNFGVGRSASGPRRFEWRWSVNSYATALPVGTVNSSLSHSSGVLTTPDANSGYTGNAISATTSGQTSITFRFYAYGAEDAGGTGGLQGNLTFGGTLVASDPTITLSSPSQTGTENINPSTGNVILSHFQAAITTANATLNTLQFTTTGSYSASDLTGNFKLFYGTSSSFGSASQIATVAVGAAGTYTFTSLSQAINSGSTGFFWITADASGTSGGNRTLTVSAGPTLSFASGTPTGSISAGGTKTFLDASTPSLSATSLLAFGSQCINNTYGPYSFTITGSALTTANVTVASLSGYTFSTTSGGTYTASLSLSQGGGAYSQEIFVKFNPTSAIAYSGNIVVGGGGASNINVAASGTGINGTVAVTTVTATSVGSAGASSGGNSVSTSCGTITAKGVVWGTSANPTVPSANSTNEGVGTANYTSTISGLSSNTLYNYRAYATSSNGVTSYGTNLTFTTLKVEPTNFPTSFACGTTGTTTIQVNWTDATGAQVPDGYLVKWSTTSYAAITAPTDGTAEADATGRKNVTQGTQTHTFSSLTSGTTYYFKIWSYTNSGTNINYKLTSEPQITCTTLTAPWEDFETGTKSSYAAANVTCTAGSWNMNDALIGTSGSDAKNGSQSVRIQNTGTATMNFNRTNGIGTVNILHAKYGSDGNSTWRLEASTDNGSNWDAYVSSTITTSSTSLTNQSFTVNLGGNVRLRIVKLSGGGSRINIDDIYVTDFIACTEPTTHTSALSTNTPTSNGFSVGWTAGSGNGTMIVVRPTAQSNQNPVSGSAYTPNLNYASAGQINTNNRVVFRSAGTSAGPITNLSAETQYTITAYEYHNTGECYKIASAPSITRYTLSNLPNTHAASFTATAVAFDQINLSFSAANTLSNADGYIILRRTAAAPTGLPTIATAYSVGNTIGDATVAAIITNTATTTASITGLSGSTNYHFTLIPYNWDGSNAQTNNYRTTATIPTANATTLAQPSQSSDIIASSGYSYNSNIDYLAYQTATITNTSNSLDIFRFEIRDGGGSADADALPTILSAITFNVTNVANVRTAALFNGNTLVNNAPTINTVAGTIAFSGMSGANVTADDGGTQTLTLRVTFNTTVTDNQQLQVTITNANSTAAGSSTSSLFSSFSSVMSSITGDRNRLEVTADRLAFVQQPTSTTATLTMSPAVTVGGKDINGSQDLDFSTTVSIACSTPASLTGNPVSAATSGGIASFAGLVHTVSGNFTLNASAPGYISATSNTYNISNFSYVSGDFRPLYATDFSYNGTWEYYNGSSWGAVPDNKAPQNTATTIGRIIVNDYVSGGGSSTKLYNADIIILAGGELELMDDNTTPTQFIGSTNKIEVQSGGVLTITGDINMPSGSQLIVRNGGTMTINQPTMVNNHAMWGGTELFEGGSTVNILDWSFGSSSTVASLMNISTAISSNANGWKFGNLILDVNTGTNNWQMVGGDIGIINLCENDFSISNASTTAYITGATNQSGTNGFVINGDMVIYDGNFAFGSSYSNNAFNHQFTINGNFDCITNDNLKVHLIGSNTPTTLSGRVTFKGNVNIASTVTSFTNDGGSGTPSRMGVVFSGGTISVPNEISIAPTATAINMNVSGSPSSYVILKNQDLTLNSVAGYTAIFTVETGAYLHFGWNGAGTIPLVIRRTTSSPAGTNQFASQTNSTLVITSADGIQQASGTTGNVQLSTANKSFAAAATYWYVGKTAQVTGDGLNGTANGKVVICDLINNTTTLTLSANTGFTNSTAVSATGGKLDIRKGQFIETTSAYVTGSTGTLYMSPGTLYRVAKGNSTAALSSADPIPRMDGNTFGYVLNGGTIELSGTGSNDVFQTVRGLRTYEYLRFSGASSSINEYKNLTNTVTVDSALVITGNAVVNCVDASLAPASFVGNGGLTMTGGTYRLCKLNTSHPELNGVASAYSLTGGTVELYGTGATQTHSLRGTDGNSNNITYHNIELNATAANLTLGSANVITGAGFGLRGTMNVNSPTVYQLGSGFTITDQSGSSTFAINAGSTFKYGGTVAASGAIGNIRTSNRNLSTTASYGFVGSVSIQDAGSGLPTSMINLYLEKNSATDVVVFGTNSTVTNTLFLNTGKLTTSHTNLLNIAAGATVSGVSDNSFVNGPVRKTGNTAFVFPTGKGSKYSPVWISAPQDVAHHFTAEYFDADPQDTYPIDTLDPAYLLSPMNYISDKEYWDVARTGGNSNVTVRLYWSSYSSGYIANMNTLRVAHWNGSYWENLGGGPTTGTPATGTIETHGAVSSFSPFALASEGEANPLPIELLNFDVKQRGNKVDIEWTTNVEINNDYFTIERTKEGINFENILEVDGAGQSNSAIKYEASDELPLQGVSYYRLRQTDFDGKESVTGLVAVNFINNASNIRPNYMSDKEVISFENFPSFPIQVSIYNLNGQLVHRSTLQEDNGIVSVLSLQPGVYVVRSQDVTGVIQNNRFVR